ncbi:hypothetical protein [Streptomyces gobiensis]|uniref:hypothetical protein n=1 Tax=Streptomyces gobiensis TaxID=2875706 RepID=UPI001E57D827|nr:hypothetical protein [Streptomyces gobiensis]UGY94414.1 hypothetical protein test1122_23565 [Streptomyces gobiensis]
MRHPRLNCSSVLGLLAVSLLTTLAPVQADPVPKTPGHRLVPGYAGAPAEAAPLPGPPPPQHPYLAPNGSNGMHGDAAASDTHPYPGPLGADPEVTSRAMATLGGECATVTFDRAGRIITVCGTFTGFLVKLLDPKTLRTLAEYQLAQRPSTIEAITRLDLAKIFTDTSGGAYAYLDHKDRLVLADSRNHLLRLAHHQDEQGQWRFTVTDDWDLGAYAPAGCVSWTSLDPTGECDPVTSVVPDWDGRIWWVTRLGRIGNLDPDTGVVRTIRLDGEEIQNSFTAGPDALSIVSDHALYSLRAATDGTPQIIWRRGYDRGSAAKPGSVNQGSGTTPTLLGDEDNGYVAITDNADDRMNVLVHRRDGELVCAVPVFDSGRSTTDNSLIGWGNSLIVENNYGYANVTTLIGGRTVTGGAARIDIRADGSGCDTVWESPVRSPSTVAKLSTGNGLLYFYTKEPNALGIDAWYLTAVDFRTGEPRWKRLTGTGPLYDNNWAPITIGPDGSAYIGVFNGLVRVADRP